MEEEKIIKDAEVETKKDVEVSEEEKIKKMKMDKYVEFLLIFVLGVLIGVAVKTEAAKRITMGFDDYLMKMHKQEYNINGLQDALAEEATEEAPAAEEETGQ